MTLILRNNNGLAYYQFEHLAAYPELQHGIFTRAVGRSEAPFDRLNVSFAVGDDPEHVDDGAERDFGETYVRQKSLPAEGTYRTVKAFGREEKRR